MPRPFFLPTWRFSRIALLVSVGALTVTACGTDTPATVFAESDFAGEYEIVNEEFGTEVRVTLTEDVRLVETNALPPWEAGEFPEGNNTDLAEQDIEYSIPLEPTFTVMNPSSSASPSMVT